jgi:hypothetical protein
MWFRIYADRFGSTNLTFLVVLVAFIGGLGVGSLASRRLGLGLSRWPALGNPLALVGAIEAGIALGALCTFLLDPSGALGSAGFPYERDARGFFEPVASLRIAVAAGAVMMLVPTFLMGTTFPILCQAFRHRAMFPSELYGWNTLGACLGVLAAEFCLLPVLGHSFSFVLLVGINLLLGGTFVWLGRAWWPRHQGRTAGPPPQDAKRRDANKEQRVAGRLYRHSVVLLVATLSGFVAGSLEVDMFRTVRFAGAITDAAMSFTSFWAITAIFTASWLVRSLGRPRPWLVRTALSGALLAHAVTWLNLPEIRGWFNDRYMAWVAANAHLDPTVAQATIYPLSASLLLLLFFTGAVVFPAYFLTSLLLPSVCNAAQAQKQHLGMAYGLNTVAFCAGAVIFTWVAPAVNLFYAVKLLFAVIAVVAILALSLRPDRPLSRVSLGMSVAAVAVAAFMVPSGFDRGFFPAHEWPARYPVRAMKSNGAITTYVVSLPEGDVLYFDSHPMSGTALHSQMYMSLMAHMPLLSHPEPRRALLICFGVGNTARAIAAHESIEAIDIVDLNDKVFETADEFAKTNDRAHRDPRVRLVHDDGRGFLARTDGRYDLVTSEPPPPREAGVYRLYSVEYYRAVRDHLTPNGMMTQWLPVNILSGDATHRTIASFLEVFPHAFLFVGHGDQLILQGSLQPFDAATLERRFTASAGARRDLADLGIVEPVQLLARILRTSKALRLDVRGVPAISDQRNDLALATSDPFDRPRFVLDFERVLAELSPQRLACGPRLQEVFGDANLLLSLVPDYYGVQITR